MNCALFESTQQWLRKVADQIEILLYVSLPIQTEGIRGDMSFYKNTQIV